MTRKRSINIDTDGRAQRTIRSRQAIVEAVHSLQVDGVLVPTAQEAADRSGLGIRTVFRHFSEIESLFIEGDRQLHERYLALPVIKPEGSLNNRIVQLVNIRASNCEIFAPHIRGALVQLWRYKHLKKSYAKMISNFRRQMFQFLPELNDLPQNIAEAAELALSFENWNRLSQCKDLSQKATIDVMLTSLNAVMSYSEKK